MASPAGPQGAPGAVGAPPHPASREPVALAGPTALFRMMEERELIRLQKESGMPRPWTTDTILHENYFCNVMREHDTVSRWVQANITDPFRHLRSLPVMLAVARQLNHIPVLEWLLARGTWPYAGGVDELAAVARALDGYPGQKFGGAYIISANGMRWGDWTSKHHYVIRGVVGAMASRPMPMDSIQDFTEALAAVPGWGGFTAYEVACDLRWAPGWLDTAPDIYTWANPGPGAARGLMDLHGLERKPPRDAMVAMMRHLLADAEDYPWGVPWSRPLEMRDIEHSLCEFNKYVRLSNGQGGKRRYPLHKNR